MNAEQAWAQLGITRHQIAECRLPMFTEATRLVAAGDDMFARPQQMTAATFDAWQAMLAAADADGIQLQLVSAFRSVQYQCELIQRKLDQGQSLEQIITVSAIPGFSEHHTGQALDLATPGYEPLEESFADSAAFSWLSANAGGFGFTLSFPRDNTWGIIYEPWHWCFASTLVT